LFERISERFSDANQNKKVDSGVDDIEDNMEAEQRHPLAVNSKIRRTLNG
jgi:hypothetical protein